MCLCNGRNHSQTEAAATASRLRRTSERCENMWQKVFGDTRPLIDNDEAKLTIIHACQNPYGAGHGVFSGVFQNGQESLPNSGWVATGMLYLKVQDGSLAGLGKRRRNKTNN